LIFATSFLADWHCPTRPTQHRQKTGRFSGGLMRRKRQPVTVNGKLASPMAIRYDQWRRAAGLPL
jgi:hypothetical protein